MAEAICRDLVRKEGLEDKIFIDSAGTGDWHIGKSPHEGTQKILTEHSIDFSGQTARQVKVEDLYSFQYIIGMDVSNIGQLHKIAGMNKVGKIARLLDFVPDGKISDVPDPYYTGNFLEVYELVRNGCHHLLDEIKQGIDDEQE